MEDERMQLKWDDFQENFQTFFKELRSDTDFTDVTLVCKDQSIEAHKVILAARSPFFNRLFKAFPHPHPLIHMRGIKGRELNAVVDFLYQGEANILQEELQSFLTVAGEFELEGLTESVEKGSQANLKYLSIKQSLNQDSQWTNEIDCKKSLKEEDQGLQM